MQQEQQGHGQAQTNAYVYRPIDPPYPGDGKVHACVPDRAVARCGLPNSSDPTVCLLVRGEYLARYAPEYRDPTCWEMVVAGEEGPREWTG